MKKTIINYCWGFLFYLIFIPFNVRAEQSSSITVFYPDPIHGFIVEVQWTPIEFRQGYVVGPAELKLTHAEYQTTANLVNEHFFIDEARLGDAIQAVYDPQQGYSVPAVVHKQVTLSYLWPAIAQEEYFFGTDDEPFFFFDIDFDGQQEFISTAFRAGQRHRNVFWVCKLSDDMQKTVLVDAAQQLTHHEPFRSLDSGSFVDSEGKRIILRFSSGAFLSSDEVFEFGSEQ